MEIKDIFT